MKDRLFDPVRTALISIDMQQAVAAHAAEPHSARDVLAGTIQIANAARAAGGLPVFVRTSFLPDESDALHPALDVARPARPQRAEGWDQLVPDLERRATEPVIVKRSFNAFHGSDLDLQLRRHRIETVVMTGISTNFGVEGTARAAYDHGYDVVFALDAMAANTTQMHESSVKNVFPYIGRVRTVTEIAAAFTGGAESAA